MPRREEHPEQPEERKGKPPEELSGEELEQQRAGELPDREALSVLGADVAIPLDPSIAAEVLSGEPEPPVEESPTREVDAVEPVDEEDDDAP
jgi:hypothetical protein